MILTDYFLCEKDTQWEFAKQCGVDHAVIRLPETPDFDITDTSHWKTICDRFRAEGITPLVVEPLPNALHDHIKAGDEKRDECLEKAQILIRRMAENGLKVLCFNFMAHVGWLRTSNTIPERGGALVTGFRFADFTGETPRITSDELWKNYQCFVDAIVPVAEHYGVQLALHPDDPPLNRISNTERIMINMPNIRRALSLHPSPILGVTMCQATYAMMGEDLYSVIPELREKIFFIHFRNARGNKMDFQETFHDNGDLDMGKLIALYQKLHLNVPIRVDHVPLMARETNDRPGYTALGRLFAIGYLKGLLDATE